MADIVDPIHEAQIQLLFARTCHVLEMTGFLLRPLRRRARGRGKFRTFALGYTKIGQNLITVDLYTPRTMQPRKTDAILRVICHELAHHQAPPKIFIRWRGFVRLAHHPMFWNQVKKNVALISQDSELGVHFH